MRDRTMHVGQHALALVEDDEEPGWHQYRGTIDSWEIVACNLGEVWRVSLLGWGGVVRAEGFHVSPDNALALARARLGTTLVLLAEALTRPGGVP